MEFESNLMCDIRPSLTDISVHLAHHTNVFIAVEQRVFFIPTRAIATTVGSTICFQAGMGEDDNQALGFLVIWRNRDMLFSDKLRQLGRGARLCP